AEKSEVVADAELPEAGPDAPAPEADTPEAVPELAARERPEEESTPIPVNEPPAMPSEESVENKRTGWWNRVVG
ncbi:MAG: hypothetical protein OEU46_19870, partial [Alphaproteobacteria bacterium]|nr:hypothetical protein [Alphaproteobacteria bacterium]